MVRTATTVPLLAVAAAAVLWFALTAFQAEAFAHDGHGAVEPPAVSHSGQHSGGHDHDFAFGEPGKAAEVDRTIEITMKDNRFEPESLSLKPGETIRFRVANRGEFLHEFGIGTAAMHAQHREQMMEMMQHGMIEVDRINRERMKMDRGSGGMAMSHDDPNSILLEPGKSGEVIWKFTRAMDLEFACNMPGHYEAGMMGEFRFR